MFFFVGGRRNHTYDQCRFSLEHATGSRGRFCFLRCGRRFGNEKRCFILLILFPTPFSPFVILSKKRNNFSDKRAEKPEAATLDGPHNADCHHHHHHYHHHYRHHRRHYRHQHHPVRHRLPFAPRSLRRPKENEAIKPKTGTQRRETTGAFGRRIARFLVTQNHRSGLDVHVARIPRPLRA